MAKKQIAKKNNTLLVPLSNSRSWINFINEDAYMDFPEKADWRKRFCFSYLEWLDKPDSIEVMQFLHEYKYGRGTFYDWVHKYPEIKRVHEHALLVLGSRRRVGALRKEFDKDVAFRDMHVYDPEWLEINKYHAELKQQYNHDNPGSFVLQMMPAPSTGMVPPLKKLVIGEEK